jgi:hypothetical protein
MYKQIASFPLRSSLPFGLIASGHFERPLRAVLFQAAQSQDCCQQGVSSFYPDLSFGQELVDEAITRDFKNVRPSTLGSFGQNAKLMVCTPTVASQAAVMSGLPSRKVF